jgi:hypothetical protein
MSTVKGTSNVTIIMRDITKNMPAADSGELNLMACNGKARMRTKLDIFMVPLAGRLKPRSRSSKFNSGMTNPLLILDSGVRGCNTRLSYLLFMGESEKSLDVGLRMLETKVMFRR